MTPPEKIACSVIGAECNRTKLDRTRRRMEDYGKCGTCPEARNFASNAALGWGLANGGGTVKELYDDKLGVSACVYALTADGVPLFTITITEGRVIRE